MRSSSYRRRKKYSKEEQLSKMSHMVRRSEKWWPVQFTIYDIEQIVYSMKMYVDVLHQLPCTQWAPQSCIASSWSTFFLVCGFHTYAAYSNIGSMYQGPKCSGIWTLSICNVWQYYGWCLLWAWPSSFLVIFLSWPFSTLCTSLPSSNITFPVEYHIVEKLVKLASHAWFTNLKLP